MYCFLKCTYIIHQGKLSILLPWLVRLLKVLRYIFLNVGMYTYKLFLCFKEGIADIVLAKQINRGLRKCI